MHQGFVLLQNLIPTWLPDNQLKLNFAWRVHAVGLSQQQNSADSNYALSSILIKSVSKQLLATHCQVLTFYLNGLETVSKLRIKCVRVADLLDCCVAI